MPHDPDCPDCNALMQAFETMSFNRNGLSDPPGWSLKKPDGSPFDFTAMERGRVDFVLWKGEEWIGEGYLEPNGNIGLN